MQMPQDHSMPSPDPFVIDANRWKEAIEPRTATRNKVRNLLLTHAPTKGRM
jgi:hypothetical protein